MTGSKSNNDRLTPEQKARRSKVRRDRGRKIGKRFANVKNRRKSIASHGGNNRTVQHGVQDHSNNEVFRYRFRMSIYPRNYAKPIPRSQRIPLFEEDHEDSDQEEYKADNEMTEDEGEWIVEEVDEEGNVHINVVEHPMELVGVEMESENEEENHEIEGEEDRNEHVSDMREYLIGGTSLSDWPPGMTEAREEEYEREIMKRNREILIYYPESRGIDRFRPY